MKRAVVIASMVGLFGSVSAIVLCYIDYNMLGISIRYSLHQVWKWPVLSMSFVLTTLSLSVPFVAHFFRDRRDPQMSIAVYALGYLWIPLFAFYPGTKALGVVSDSVAAYAWFSVCVTQYIAAKIVLKAITVQAHYQCGLIE